MSYNDKEVKIQKYEGINFKSNYEDKICCMDILYINNNKIWKILKVNIGKLYIKNSKKTKMYIYI